MYNWQDLLHLMSRLRDPQTGCPWDKQQTLSSIVPHTLEEVYEVVDAIERDDWTNLTEELGDLLFQVVFYAQIMQEQQQADMTVIIDGLVTKLLHRHPHVFVGGLYGQSQVNTQSNDQLHRQWDRLKEVEKPQPTALLDTVPLAMPALQRALKLQKKAAKVGFDWPDVTGPQAKIAEELAELLQADAEHQVLEAGDLLFSVVNLLRKMGIDPETALRHSNQKFQRRFTQVEAKANEQGGMAAQSLATLDAFWHQVKEEE